MTSLILQDKSFSNNMQNITELLESTTIPTPTPTPTPISIYDDLKALDIDSSKVTICLNMIVKNESKIITRLLESVLPIIDTY